MPCLVLLDLKMPRLGGNEFRRAQLGDPTVASVPVAVMSGATDLEQRAQALGAVASLSEADRLRYVDGCRAPLLRVGGARVRTCGRTA